ncbi:MAG: hypothetical protein ACOYOP_05860 [Microthrixaceae bacterium]
MGLTHLYLVYDADAGVRGELAYVVGKLRGRHCALCDITHGTLRRKPEWDAFTCSLEVPFDVWHRNEQTPEVAEFTRGMGAVVVGRADGGLAVLLDDAALDACGGDVDRFAAALRAAMDRFDAQRPA